jgi:hypothetical protein
MTSLRDNPIAISEGAVGAPRVQADAMGGSVAGDNLLFKSVPARVAGDSDTSPWTLVNSTTCFRATTTCEIRITVTRLNSVGIYGYRILKNSVVVATTTSAAFLSADISLVAGDVIWVEARGGSGSGGGATPGSVDTVTEYKVGDIRSVGGI